MATKIQLRRDTSTNWNSNNPVLSSGEVAFSTDLGKIKIGNGTANWQDLPYVHLTPAEISASYQPLDSDLTALAAISASATGYVQKTGDGNWSIADVSLGNNTSGNYVETLIAGDGVSISGEGSESASVTLTNTGVLSLSGTNNEVDVSSSAGNITLSLPTSITVDLVGDVTGNADTASTIATPRNISLGGDLSGSASFDGSADITITATVADDSHNHTIANVDGLQTAIDTAESDAVTSANSYTDTEISTHNSDTTSVHGIADTSALATKTYADNAGVTSLTGTASEIDVSASSGAVTLSLPTTINADTTGNAATASTLETARSISLGGDISGSASFNGGSNITITATVADDSHNHIISNVDGLQTELNNKAPLESPALTGTPTAPTASASVNSTQIATTAFVQTAVNNVIDGAPGALDTLNELAAALGDDANFASTVTNSLAGKQPIDSDLTAIAGLSASATGYAKKTGDGTWSVGDVALGTDTTGNYIATISGTENEIEVSGSGSENAAVTISLPSTINANTTGSAASLTTARTISLGGDLSGSASFNGTSNITITAEVADDSHNHIISNVDGLQTALDAKAPLSSPTFTGTTTIPTLSLTTEDTSTTATHYMVEVGTDGIVRPKTLANVRTEVVTNAAVNAAAVTTVGTITSGTWAATDIALAHGGTNASLSAVNGGVVYSTSSALAITSAGTAGQVLISNGSSAPTWGTVESGFNPFLLLGV